MDRLIEALERAANELRVGAPYQWGHFGACNCGHLARALTARPVAEIHAAAVERAADWGDAAVEYCPTSGLPLDHIITEMLAAGVTLDELRHLERLSDRKVLRRVGRPLRHNRRDDVIAYLQAWASLLREEQVVWHAAAE